ncbi:hypothetical protein SEUCBS140593_003137 [Sporothrix eucalyptigena]|uniref:Uncharacterized protein n=1 Tax=Sporothrix eucalyptigena TaxID=1812306 RepID=A0ABP0BCI0_9PEZI
MSEYQTFEEQCRGAISLVPVYFSIVSGQVRTQSDASLQTILSHVLHQLAGIQTDSRLDLAVFATPAAEAAILRVIYDAGTLPLVLTRRWATDADTQAVALLDPQQKARLLVEGIAGAVAIVSQVASHAYSGRLKFTELKHELHRFAASTRPQHIRDAVEHSHLFSECLMMSQVLDLIMDAAHDEPLTRRKVATFDDYSTDVFCSDRQRATAHSMGMPWGLEFMMLN